MTSPRLQKNQKPSFTPGPWQLTTVPFELRNHDSAACLYGPGTKNGGACLIADISRSPGDDEATANANLFFAAPDMYEALRRVVNYFSDVTGVVGGVAVIEEAKQVIAKAEGKEVGNE